MVRHCVTHNALANTAVAEKSDDCVLLYRQIEFHLLNLPHRPDGLKNAAAVHPAGITLIVAPIRLRKTGL